MSAASDRAARLAKEPLRRVDASEGLISGALLGWRAIFEHHELLGEMVKREIKARYKDSGLGVLWSFIRPLAQLLVYYLVMGKFLGAQRSIPMYAVFVFTGITLWSMFSEVITTATQSILANAGIIKKVQMPREILPLSSVGAALFNFLVQVALLIVAALILGHIPFGKSLLYAPAAALVAVTWATALALILSAANVYLRDVRYLIEVVLMVGFWFSPIVYQWAMVNRIVSHFLMEIYLCNPMTVCILAFQRAIWGTPTMPNGTPANELYPAHLGPRLMVMWAIGLLLLLVAQRIFYRLQRNFAQEI